MTHPLALRFPDLSRACPASRDSATRLLRRTLSKVCRFRAAGAYLHQYQRWGVSRAALDDSLAALEQLLADYANL